MSHGLPVTASCLFTRGWRTRIAWVVSRSRDIALYDFYFDETIQIQLQEIIFEFEGTVVGDAFLFSCLELSENFCYLEVIWSPPLSLLFLA